MDMYRDDFRDKVDHLVDGQAVLMRHVFCHLASVSGVAQTLPQAVFPNCSWAIKKTQFARQVTSDEYVSTSNVGAIEFCHVFSSETPHF